jgi:hypothetical protein
MPAAKDDDPGRMISRAIKDAEERIDAAPPLVKIRGFAEALASTTYGEHCKKTLRFLVL